MIMHLYVIEKKYHMKNYLSHKLSTSNFSYRDLFFDPSENKVSTCSST